MRACSWYTVTHMGKQKNKRRTLSKWEKQTIGRLKSSAIGDLNDPKFIFLVAIGEGQTKEAKRLIQEGWVNVHDLYPESGNSMTLLQQVAIAGNLDLTRFMVKHGADPDRVGPQGTALHCAGRFGREEVFQYLKTVTNRKHHELALRYLQDGERRPREETEAVHRLTHACLMGQSATVNRLLAKGVDVNLSTIGSHGCCAIHAASKGGHATIVQMLLAAGANPNATSYDGVGPLACAANRNVCRLLLKAGADVNHRDQFGCTPLMSAVNREVFRCLVQAGATLTIVDNLGRGALLSITASIRSRTTAAWPKTIKIDSTFDRELAQTFRELIKAGVSVNDCQPTDQTTALMLVAGMGLYQAAVTLIKAGASVGAKDKAGNTAESYAPIRSPLRKLLGAT